MSVAAVLLIMLIAQRKPPASDHRTETAAVGVASKPQSTVAEVEQYRSVPFSEETRYLNLRDQVLRYGVESWKSPVAAVALPAGKTETPLTYREQLDSLLQQQDMRGS